jgi:hypothetical protein
VQVQFQIDALQWEISETENRIANISEELNVIRAKGQRYDEILLTGFREPQDRLAASQLVEELAVKHELTLLNYGLEPEAVSEINTPSEVAFVLSQTTIRIEMQGYTDYDLTGFAADFIESLQGQVQVKGFELERKNAINDELMLRIASGASSGAFSGSLLVTWNNVDVRPPPDESEEEAAQ